MKKLLTLLVLSLLLHLQGFSQAKKVSGRITNEKGDPVAFASVKIKEKNTGVSSDENGRYAITARQGDVLVITAASIVTKEIEVGQSDVIDVQVNTRDAVLGEVIVTALGIKREKRQLSTATQVINADQLNKSGSGNPLSELNGKASGLTVINSTGDPGGGTYMRLRGVTSITGNNQPLMVVDGIPIDNSINNYDPNSAVPDVSGANSNLVAGTQPTNRGVDINPNDIESITVLKGPAATALYGIQAASGALIITTKKGGSGRRGPSITFNSSYTFDKVNKLPKRQKIYSQGSDGLYDGPENGQPLSWGARVDTLYWDGIPTAFDKNGSIVGMSDPSAQTPVRIYDPYDFFQTGFTSNNNIAVSGGNANSGFRLSLGHLHQNGVIPRANYNKTTFNLSGQSDINDKLTVSAGLNLIYSKSYKVQQGSNQSGIMLGLLRTPPTFDNSNGLGKDAVNDPTAYILQDGSGMQRSYRGGVGYDNPYWVVNRIPFTEDMIRTFGFAQAGYKFNDWLSASYRIGGDMYAQNAKNAFDIGSNAFSEGALHLLNYTNRQFNSDFTVTMKKSLSDDFDASLLLGHNYFTYTYRARLTHGSGFKLPAFFDISNAISSTGDEVDEKKRTMAFYGEAHLDYKDMLFLTLTGRRETSSTLPEKNNSFFYPSAGLAWEFTRLSNYPSGSILNYGKIRASFAQVGKDAPVQGLKTYYLRAQLNDGFTTGLVFPINGNSGYQYSSTIATIGNPDLKAEKTNSYEIGADLNFFKNRISFNGTYYYSKSTDIILVAPIAYSSGFSSKLVNAGAMRNQGVELTLNTTPVKTKDFTWDMNFNWSRNRNKVLYLTTDKLLIAGFTNGEVDAIAGKAFGQIYGNFYVRSNPDDMNSPLLINDDPSDEGYGMPIVSSQSAAIGDVNPDWTGSVINNLTYKRFMLGIQLDIRKGGDIWNGTRGALEYFGISQATANRGATTVFNGVLGHLNDADEVVHFKGSVEEAGPGAVNDVTATYNQYYWQNIGGSFIGPAESSVEDASFVRIRQISLGYDLPTSFIRKAKFSAVSVTLFANNPVLWTKYSGVDPETSLAGPANGQGLDYFNNPGTKSYGIRLNVAL